MTKYCRLQHLKGNYCRSCCASSRRIIRLRIPHPSVTVAHPLPSMVAIKQLEGVTVRGMPIGVHALFTCVQLLPYITSYHSSTLFSGNMTVSRIWYVWKTAHDLNGRIRAFYGLHGVCCLGCLHVPQCMIASRSSQGMTY